MDLSKNYMIDKDRVVYRIIDGEAVILNLENGYYYSLDEVGAEIWQAINNHKSPNQIVTALEEEYSVPKERLKKDIAEILKSLLEEKLIKKSVNIIR